MLCPQGTPYVVGGAERLWQGIVDAFNERGEHTAAIVGVAAPESSFSDLIQSYSNFDILDLSEYDLVISGKYPAWMVQHPRHVVYMCHTLRGLYDTYDPSLPQVAAPVSPEGRELLTAVTRFTPGDAGARPAVLAVAHELIARLPAQHPDLAFPAPLIRDVVRWLDADALHPRRIARYLAISRTVANRPGYFPIGADVGVVVPPSGLHGLHSSRYASFFTASRLDPPKRIDLIVRAMQHVVGEATLRIAGTGPAEQSLRDLVGDDPRVTFLGRVSDQRLVEEYAAALAVPFVPYDEDLGLIAIEGQMSSKPIITCSDSGGTSDLVQDGVDGLVVEPTPEAIGRAMTKFIENPSLARTLGAHARHRAERITWDAVLDLIVSPPAASVVAERGEVAERKRIVVLNTYSALPARHGGQIRINRLYSALARHHDVQLIAIVDDPSSVSCQVAPGFTQTVIHHAPHYQQLRQHLTEVAEAPAGDIAAALSDGISEEFSRLATNAIRFADAVILPHPYLYPLVRSLQISAPIIYDSQNAEWSLKSDIYPRSSIGRALATAVAELERALVRRAALVTAVSEDDESQLLQLSSTMADFAIVPNGGDFSTTEFVMGDERRRRRAVFLDSLRLADIPVGSDHVVLFVGSGHAPNVEAATRVLEAAQSLPDVLFVLVGSHVAHLDGTPTGTNVIARGVVNADELSRLLSLATVAVNPMSTGSGTNIKMLDYLAHGTPAIASAIGARGLPVEDGRHLLIAQPADLVDAIGVVIADPEAADQRALEGRRITEAFDWQVLGARFAELVGSVIAGA